MASAGGCSARDDADDELTTKPAEEDAHAALMARLHRVAARACAAAGEQFYADHDQRWQSQFGLSYQHPSQRVYASLTGRFDTPARPGVMVHLRAKQRQARIAGCGQLVRRCC